MRCLSCLRTISKDVKFCAYCGAPQQGSAAYNYLLKATQPQPAETRSYGARP